MQEPLEKIKLLAQQCDEELALELNRRLQAILDWVQSTLEHLPDP